MSEYVPIAFIDFMLNNKRLTNFTHFFAKQLKKKIEPLNSSGTSNSEF